MTHFHQSLLCLFILFSTLYAFNLEKSIVFAKFEQSFPKMVAKVGARVHQMATIKRQEMEAGISRVSKGSDKCLQAYMNTLSGNSNATILTMIMDSFKGFNDIGDYKACLKANGTRYILLLIKISSGTPSSGNFGICGPKECTAEDYSDLLKPTLTELIKQLMDELDVRHSGFFEVNDETIRFIDVEQKNNEMGKIGPLSVILIICGILLVIACCYFTYQDYVRSKGEFKGDVGSKLIECWSVVRNCRDLFYKKNPVDLNLEILNGVRVLSMCWVISGHTFDFFNVSPLSNLTDITDYIEHNYWIQTWIAGTFSIDVFFFLSGFLCAITMTAQLADKAENLQQGVKTVIVCYVHRYIRLLPLYLLGILAAMSIIPWIFSEGPLAVFNEWGQGCCERKWFQNLLYVQNFYQIGEGCLIWTWYLANDMQFFLVTPIIIILYNKSRKYGLLSLLLFAIGSTCAQIYVINHYNLSTSYFFQANGDLFDDYYVKPYNRLNTYILGIIVAWMYLSYKDEKYKITAFNAITKFWIEKDYLRYFLYFVGILITYICIYLQWVMDHDWRSIRTWHNALYIIVARPLFVIGLLFVIYPAMMGKEKIINAILGAPFWNVLAKLTYGAYLYHVLILIAEKSADYHSSYFTIMRVLFFSIHLWVLSYFVSLIFTLFLELPIAQMDKNFLFPKRREAVDSLNKQKAGITAGDKKDTLLPTKKDE